LVTEDDCVDNDIHEGYRQRFAFKVDWRSKFADLFECKNEEALEHFRTCKDITNAINNLNSRGQKRIRNDEWREAEIAWMNVEKKLRLLLFRSIVDSEAFRSYVQALEIVLLSLVETKKLPSHSMLPSQLTDVLRSNLLVDEDGNAQLLFKDLPFHRLLLHATCQFYGLKSQSYYGKCNKSQKITAVLQPKRMSNVVLSKISLVGFLFSSIDRSTSSADPIDNNVLDVSLAKEIELLMSEVAIGSGDLVDSNAGPPVSKTASVDGYVIVSPSDIDLMITESNVDA